ncbi:hypothetical protein ACIQNU_20145 [Streptomyces sp. NPDC091292]|uniref:hypothetical protein n=1 Tax=Streptomyces sp. NPDC091292 TaxID=3365991 RepID=UPI0037F1D837
MTATSEGAPRQDPYLTEVQRIAASGARAAEPIRIGDLELLAIPQLSYDAPGTPPGMNGGDSDTELLLLRRGDGDRYEPWGKLTAPGGEDAEFFRIGERSFLAVASIRSGSGPYRYVVDSTVFAWDGGAFVPFQSFPGFAAKQWRHFTIGDRHFLALAQGVAVPGHESENRPSEIHEWNGERFEHFQDIPSQWAYNWHALTVDGTHFLAHADHVTPSVLYRWDGARFVAHQELAARTGRAFASFTDPATNTPYLVVACIEEGSAVWRWNRERGVFEEHQRIGDGLGARELAVIRTARGLYVVRVNFILGTPADPTTALASQIYRWQDEQLVRVGEFPTTGGTDVAVLADTEGRGVLLVQTNALSPDVRFAADSVVYRFTDQVVSTT